MRSVGVGLNLKVRKREVKGLAEKDVESVGSEASRVES